MFSSQGKFDAVEYFDGIFCLQMMKESFNKLCGPDPDPVSKVTWSISAKTWSYFGHIMRRKDGM